MAATTQMQPASRGAEGATVMGLGSNAWRCTCAFQQHAAKRSGPLWPNADKRSGPLWPWAMFWDGQSMRELVNQTDQAAVMDFIVACFDSFIQTD